MSLDIPVNESSLEEYEQMKMKNIYNFLVFAIKDDESECAIESKAPPDTPFSSILKYLPPKEARFIFVHLHFKTNDVPPRSIQKMVAIRWCPQGVPIKQKFMYASASQKFYSKLTGIHKTFDAFKEEELDEKVLQELFK